MNLDKSINNEFEQTLIDNGYKFFQDNWKHSLRGFQKRFSDEKGTKYFITGYHYNFKKQFPERSDITDDGDRYNFTAQFIAEKRGKDKTIDVSYSADFIKNAYREITTLKEVEDFFEKMFIDFNFNYYELKEGE